jgi:hypothetical protein
MEQLLRFTLTFGQRAPGALDVGTGAVMVALEEHDSRPDADRVLVMTREIVIEPGKKQLLDSRLTVGVVWRFRRPNRVSRLRIRHPGR